MTSSWEKALSRDVFSEFVGKHVMIAGVGRDNIGAALAEGFHYLGSHVTAIGHERQALEILAAQLADKKLAGAHPLKIIAADLTDDAQRTAALDDALSDSPPVAFISTLGNDTRVKLPEMSASQLRRLSLINWEVPVLMAASVIAPMRQAGGGCICLFSSHHGSGHLVDRDLMAYGASKAALENAVVRLAHEAAELNTPENIVRVIGLRPGWVQSALQRARFPGAFEEATRTQLIPTEMHPHDLIAQVVAHTSHIFGGLTSGVTLPIDNGRTESPVRDKVFGQA